MLTSEVSDRFLSIIELPALCLGHSVEYFAFLLLLIDANDELVHLRSHGLVLLLHGIRFGLNSHDDCFSVLNSLYAGLDIIPVIVALLKVSQLLVVLLELLVGCP